jgi:hypothetical protein
LDNGVQLLFLLYFVDDVQIKLLVAPLVTSHVVPELKRVEQDFEKGDEVKRELWNPKESYINTDCKYKYKNVSEGISNDTTLEALEKIPYEDEGTDALHRDDLIPFISVVVCVLHLLEIVHFDDLPESQYHAASLNC